MLSLCELKRAVAALGTRLGGTRLERIIQTEDYLLVLTFAVSPRSEAGTHHVALSCSPEFARISICASPPQAPPTPPAFAQYLRAHLAGARFRGIEVLGEDRQAAISLAAAEGQFQLLLSIFGPRSNLYLLDAGGILIYAMRPLEETRREIARGAPWTNPGTTLRSPGVDRWADVPGERYLEEIERSYERLIGEKRYAELLKRVSNALQKEADALARKAANMQQDLNEAIEAEQYRRKGELLKNVLHTVSPGMESVTVTDFETGELVTIALDPQISASANLESYFNRYQKELRGASHIRKQLESLRQEREQGDLLRGELQSLAGQAEPDLRKLEEFASRPRLKKLLGRYSPAHKHPAVAPKRIVGRTAVSSRLLPKRFKSSDGLEIWVGRSDEGNDYLTMRLAHGNDLFFHLEGFPGSHVVLRTQGRTDPPPGSVLDACEVAVHFSKLKDSRRADVHVAPIKNLRKPRGAKPGLVHVLKGRTIHLRRDPARLERVLASRLDE